MRGTCRFGLAALIVLTFASLPALAAEGVSPACGIGSAEPLWQSSKKDPQGGVSGHATCYANCATGSVLSVTCGGSCTAVDANCPSHPGYVLCHGSGSITYCSPGCPPSAPSCEALNGTSCSPSGSKRPCILDGFTYECTCHWGSWLCPI